MSKNYPGFCNKAYPEVFDLRAMPDQAKQLLDGQLGADQVKQFFEKGFVIIPDFFKKEELDACRADIEILVDNVANLLYDNGKIKDLYKDKGLFQRLTFIENDFPGANILMHKEGRLMESFQALWANKRLLNVAEQIIGPEIMGHPVWNLRTKTPQNEASTVPWHQDSAYLDNNSYNVLQLAAWIPFLDANEKNGCMEVMSGGHLEGKVARHTCCWGNTWYVVMDEQDAQDTLKIDMERDKVLCPVPYGGMLLINNLIPHRSLNNLSDDIRWSLDLRWQKADHPVGFYDMKEGVVMRSARTPVTQIDWDSFNQIDRHKEQDTIRKDDPEVDRFDTVIVGPWMKKWEMTHSNRHTDRLTQNNEVTWHKA